MVASIAVWIAVYIFIAIIGKFIYGYSEYVHNWVDPDFGIICDVFWPLGLSAFVVWHIIAGVVFILNKVGEFGVKARLKSKKRKDVLQNKRNLLANRGS